MHGQWRVGRGGSGNHIVARLQVDQPGLRAEVTTLHLKPGDLHQGGTRGEKTLGQIQQFTDAGIEGVHPPVDTHHEDALADAAQGGLQQARLLGELHEQCLRCSLGSLALGDVGMRADHPQRFAIGIAADHHAPR